MQAALLDVNSQPSSILPSQVERGTELNASLSPSHASVPLPHSSHPSSMHTEETNLSPTLSVLDSQSTQREGVPTTLSTQTQTQSQPAITSALTLPTFSEGNTLSPQMTPPTCDSSLPMAYMSSGTLPPVHEMQERGDSPSMVMTMSLSEGMPQGGATSSVETMNEFNKVLEEVYDEEVESMLLNEEEQERKLALWKAANSDWLKEQERRKKEKEAQGVRTTKRKKKQTVSGLERE